MKERKSETLGHTVIVLKGKKRKKLFNLPKAQ